MSSIAHNRRLSRKIGKIAAFGLKPLPLLALRQFARLGWGRNDRRGCEGAARTVFCSKQRKALQCKGLAIPFCTFDRLTLGERGSTMTILGVKQAHSGRGDQKASKSS